MYIKHSWIGNNIKCVWCIGGPNPSHLSDFQQWQVLPSDAKSMSAIFDNGMAHFLTI